MNDSAIVVRPYAENDRAGVRALLAATFGDSLGFDRFERGNPLGEPIRVIAAADNRIVGFNQWQPWLIHGAEVVSTFQSGASAVDASTRGHGVFARLLAEGEAQAAQRRVGFFIGFPNPASLNSFVRAGWKVVQNLDLRCTLVPAFGPAVSGNQALSSLPAFQQWRYRAAGVEAALVGTEKRIAIFRRVRELGLPALKLLDVLTAEGKRPEDVHRGLAAALPGGRIITLRSSRPLSDAFSFKVPRRWKTPFIVRRITGSTAEEATLARCNLFYGDIDAS